MRRHEQAELAQFARKCLGYAGASEARFEFRSFHCPSCLGAEFVVVVEHHTGSRPANFRGKIRGRCLACGSEAQLYSFTGRRRRLLRETPVVCNCGQELFVVGEGERFEDEEGLPGFFDEGVVVARCIGCGRNHVVVEID